MFVIKDKTVRLKNASSCFAQIRQELPELGNTRTQKCYKTNIFRQINVCIGKNQAMLNCFYFNVLPT
jgi:hypothetical protein